MKRYLTLFIVLLTIVTALATGCSQTEKARLRVATSTSLLAYIVEQVGGDRIEVLNLVPPNQHPGNFDVKPGDIEKLSSARLFLLHGWPGEGYADKLIAAANNPDLTVNKANVNGNWMIPSVQQAAVDVVVNQLVAVDSANASAYQKAAESYKKRIQSKETDIKSRLVKAGVSTVNVIASARQADFLQWAGFNVVATFIGPQSLTPQSVKEIVDKGRPAKVSLVINNLQDGQDAGKAIATELGAINLNLSNFPGGLENTETWEKAIDRNVSILLDAVARANTGTK
ncbi:MAG: metal ABC transporter substrate-binding protein [Dehalococcoidia bacterium]|nr:metal ABC transporter substrate-binding protein [Dehalococcoidia bacterium]